MRALFALLGVAAIGGAIFFFPRRADAAEATDEQETPMQFDNLFQKYGAANRVDPLLLRAVATIESAMNPIAIRDNPPHDVSVGLMQILCLPDTEGYCTNRLNVDGWQGMTFEALKDPETNINIGAQILAWNLRQFGFPRGVAVYNSWSARHAAIDGPFPNDDYVAKVLGVYNRLKGE